jgi:hypothetical protein
MPRFLRIVAVTSGLVATGAVVGGACASLALALYLVATEGFPVAPHFVDALVFAGTVGATLGVISAPLIAWGLLRHVPLGRAITHSAVGAVAGGLLGAVVGGPSFIVPALGGALGGFILAATRLFLKTPRAQLTIAE